jgi:hypothetical protein
MTPRDGDIRRTHTVGGAHYWALATGLRGHGGSCVRSGEKPAKIFAFQEKNARVNGMP